MSGPLGRWRDLSDAVSRAIDQPTVKGARVLHEILRPFGSITWDTVFSGGPEGRAIWISHVGTTRDGCGRLRISYRPVPWFSLPVPWTVLTKGARLEFLERNRTVLHPVGLSAARACELAWLHWAQCEADRAQKGADPKIQKQILRAPVRGVLQLRWDASESDVELAMESIADADRELHDRIVRRMSGAGSGANVEAMLRDPGRHRVQFAQIDAELHGRRLEIVRTCRDLVDVITRSRL